MTAHSTSFNASENYGGATLPISMSRAEFIIETRDKSLAKARSSAELMKTAYADMNAATSSAALILPKKTYDYSYSHSDNRHYQSLFNRDFDCEAAVEAYRKALDADIWRALIAETGIETLMDREAREAFRKQLASTVPEVTLDNLRATMEQLYADKERMFLRGLANVFSKLDRRFKSHDTFKIGSRIVLTHMCSYDWGFSRHSSGAELLDDVDRVVRRLLGKEDAHGALSAELEAANGNSWNRKQVHLDKGYLRLRLWLNGNIHLYFSDEAQTEINRALARHYGEVVPDAAPRDMTAEEFTVRGANLPTKDFAFYATPEAAADAAMSHGPWLHNGMRVLEPSAGTGGLIRALRKAIAARAQDRHEERRLKEQSFTVDAIEIHPARAAQLRRLEGDLCSVIEGNFLNIQPTEDYDMVLMNPPFQWTTWADHVRHAYDFLAPGGSLVAILPFTAELGESARHGQFHRWLDGCSRYRWHDLPAGSFASSGTNINTVVLTLTKHA